MTRSGRAQALHILSIAAFAVPFAFAVLRGAHTGSDWRYLWVAIATFVGATLVMVAGRWRERPSGTVLVLTLLALVGAMLVGSLAIRVLLSAMPGGAWAVDFFFSGCAAAGYALDAFSRPRVDAPVTR